MEHLALGRNHPVKGVCLYGKCLGVAEVALEGEEAGAAESVGPQGEVQQLLHLGHIRHDAALAGSAPHPDDELLAVSVDEDLGGVVGTAIVAEVELGVVDDKPLPVLERGVKILNLTTCSI